MNFNKPPPLPVHRIMPCIRNSMISLDSDNTSSSNDSDMGHSTHEHDFWRVHSSTTVITPMLRTDYEAIEMDYQPPKPKRPLSLALQVNQFLNHTFDAVDEEIEKEWDQSRLQLEKNLTIEPKISLDM